MAMWLWLARERVCSFFLVYVLFFARAGVKSIGEWMLVPSFCALFYHESLESSVHTFVKSHDTDNIISLGSSFWTHSARSAAAIAASVLIR